MNRKIALGVSFALLFIAFGLVSLLVIVTKRHPYFVSKKLRLGALIISLSGAMAGCVQPIGYVTCYVPAPSNLFQIDQADNKTGEITLSKAVSDTITGSILERQGNTFSYAIADSADIILIKDNITALDGNFDEDKEEFKIGFGQVLLPGRYDLKLYSVPKDSIKNADWYNRSFPLVITP